LVVLVSITGMATALLTSLNERRREMAVLRLTDYLELLDWIGRAIMENKRGFVPP
jgi:hypothetical protein